MEMDDEFASLREMRARGDYPGTCEGHEEVEASSMRNPDLHGIPDALNQAKGCYDLDHAGGCG